MKPPASQSVATIPAAALVVSNMIGIGIFTALGYQIAGFSRPNGTSELTGSVFPILMLWVVGGILALCGALCYAELATALPRSGGEYNFLSRIYHPAVGFCTGLCSATIGFAAPTAVNAIYFAKFLRQAFPAVGTLIPNNSEHLIAFLLVLVAAAAHLRSIRFSGAFQAITTGTTVLLIAALVVAGFSTVPTQPITFLPHRSDWTLLVSTAFGSSLLWVMYSYSGWNAAAYIAGEVRNPARTLPRALILGTAFVLVLYLAVISVFLYSTPLGKLIGQPEVAHLVGVQIFGEQGARIGSGLICVGLVANVSGMLWLGSRVTQAMGATYPALGLLGRRNEGGVPYVALIYQFAITAGLLFLDPDNIVNYVESVLFFWSMLAVLGVIVLRIREPDLPRPYRTWGYPVTPILFAVVALFGLCASFLRHPTDTITGAVTVLIGVPIYYWVSRNVNPATLRSGGLPESS